MVRRGRSLLTAILLVGAGTIVGVQLARDDGPNTTLPGSAAPTTSTTLPTSGPDMATVAYVFDGDTIEVEVGGDTERVRLIGVDAPEARVEDGPAECFSAEATAITRDLLPTGTRVRLERGIAERDRFGRLLAYVFRVPDGTFVNEEILRRGAGEVLVLRPNTAHADRFRNAAADAEKAGRGQWSACP